MQTIVVILALVGCSIAFPQNSHYIVARDFTNSYTQEPSGAFTSKYQTADGALVEKIGFLKPTNDGLDVVVANQGTISYTSPEGYPIQLTYIADEYGARFFGNALPQAVAPIPASF